MYQKSPSTENSLYVLSQLLLLAALIATPFQNFKYLHRKKISDMLDSSQFLDILHAESQLLINISVVLPDDIKAQFERNLNEAFASDSYSDTAKAWNEERSRVVHETLENHLIPMGAKWTREWLREEVEDYLAARCGDTVKDVCGLPKSAMLRTDLYTSALIVHRMPERV